MAAYLRLTRLEDEKVFTGGDLIELDSIICNAVGDKVHELHWCRGWMDSIGFSLAMGDNWLDVRKKWAYDKDLVEIIDFLAHSYYNTSYTSR